MRRLHLLAAVALLGGSASAADPDLLPPAPDLDAVMGESGGALYARADIGYTEPLDRFALFGPPGPLDRRRIEGAASFGGGVGYRAGGWLRADVTIDHRSDMALGGLRPNPTYAVGAFQDRGRLSATTALANVYLDLPLWTGIVPYLGAGLGISHNRLAGASTLASVGGVATGFTTYPSRGRTEWAWALAAGVAIEVAPALDLDFGYRYLHLGHARTGPDAAGARLSSGAVEAHEWRLGLRYAFPGAL